jgi:hypothetical protein
MKNQTVLWTLLGALSACATTTPTRDSEVAVVTDTPASSDAPESADATTAAPHCSAGQFVACESGEACATKAGALVHPKPCVDRAAAACAALSCAHGCNIHHGEPKQVHCAPNASSSSRMQRCGGLANWACPENMTCQLPAQSGFDQMGTCVQSH